MKKLTYVGLLFIGTYLCAIALFSLIYFALRFAVAPSPLIQAIMNIVLPVAFGMTVASLYTWLNKKEKAYDALSS